MAGKGKFNFIPCHSPFSFLLKYFDITSPELRRLD